MSASFRPFRAVSLAVITLLAVAPSAASANSYGTLIEYAGDNHLPAQVRLIFIELLKMAGFGH